MCQYNSLLRGVFSDLFASYYSKYNKCGGTAIFIKNKSNKLTRDNNKCILHVKLRLK